MAGFSTKASKLQSFNDSKFYLLSAWQFECSGSRAIFLRSVEFGGAFLLLFAVYGKLTAWLNDPFQAIGFLTGFGLSYDLQFFLFGAVLAFETFVAGYLFCGLGWKLPFVVFFSFASISFYAGINGFSCGCMGSIDPNPWLIFSLDVMVVLGLLVAVSMQRSVSQCWCGP